VSAATAVLPYLQAFAYELTLPVRPANPPARRRKPEAGFYRTYTEAMLRRYVRMSREVGKVPSLLGQEMFRGKVTNYRVDHFDDLVIFRHDVERCLAKLDPEQQSLIARLAIQEYTVMETAALTGLNKRTVIRRYGVAIDQLTQIFLQAKMLRPQKRCQGA
jgi:DNA-directed RNA polymerase specialized sigma24 family protein